MIDVHEPVRATVDLRAFQGARHGAITWHHQLRKASELAGTLWDIPWWGDPQGGRAVSTSASPARCGRTRTCGSPVVAGAVAAVPRPLPEVLASEVMDPIGASDSWQWHGYRNSDVVIDGQRVRSVSVGAHWGGGLWASASSRRPSCNRTRSHSPFAGHLGSASSGACRATGQRRVLVRPTGASRRGGRLLRLREATRPVQRQLASARQPESDADEPHPEHLSPVGEMSFVGWVPARLGAQSLVVHLTLERPRTIMVHLKVLLGMHGNRLAVEMAAACAAGRTGKGRFALAGYGPRAGITAVHAPKMLADQQPLRPAPAECDIGGLGRHDVRVVWSGRLASRRPFGPALRGHVQAVRMISARRTTSRAAPRPK